MRKIVILTLAIATTLVVLSYLTLMKEVQVQPPRVTYEGIVLPIQAMPFETNAEDVRYLISQSLRTFTEAQLPTISVSGTWQKSLETNIIIVSFAVKVRADTASEAVESVAERMGKIVDKLKELNVSEDKIYTKKYTMRPVYDYEKSPPQLVGYEVEHVISVEFEDKALAAKSIDEVSPLGVTSISVAFSIDKEEFMNAYKQALSQAVASALEKAKVIAEAANIELGKIVSISETGYVTVPRYDTFAVAQKSTEFYRTEVTISAHVRVVVEIVQD